ncbi:MAG: adenylyl-sulfate kinase [Nitrosospira sp.]|nr:adenylyl-sulfate kinase [Nitrosospira sp.]
MAENPPNVVFHAGYVSREERESLLGQNGVTMWLTGLSAAGKSTLAFALERALVTEGHACYVLDGDNVRHGLNKNLSFSAEDRTENIRRVAEVARLMNDAGLMVITAFISPFIADRQMARQIIGSNQFREIFVSTPLAVCEFRDPKGMYSKARAGQLQEFTGISSPYENPEHPDLTLDTAQTRVEDAVVQLTQLIRQE